MNNATTIEDLLEITAGLRQASKIQIASSDITIVHSIARQVFKGTALTDRQYNLMKEKLSNYKDQFSSLDCDFEVAIEQLRQPLRKIDRSKYIKICTSEDEILLKGIDHKQKWIKIRFPFKKSIIVDIQNIAHMCENYVHTKGSHEHFFELTDIYIKKILDVFLNKDFEIDKQLVERYNDIQKIAENKFDYLPHFNGNKLINCDERILQNLESEITNISKQNFVKIADRHIRHGYFVDCPKPKNLIEEIAFRDNIVFHSDPKVIDQKFVLTELYHLDRFPLLVLLDEENAETQLHSVYSFFRDLIPAESQSVLFRQEGSTGFNEFVREKNLNNWVDSTTKIVYINTKKIPKIILSTDWKPITSFSFTSTLSRDVYAFINFYADLQIFHETHMSPFRRYSKLYG